MIYALLDGQTRIDIPHLQRTRRETGASRVGRTRGLAPEGSAVIVRAV
jgi:hypothetical protein